MKTLCTFLKVCFFGLIMVYSINSNGQSKLELMQHWAPQVYQDTRQDLSTVIPLVWTHQFYEAQDFILKVNYDENWYAGDQRENSELQASSCGEGFEGHAYASMVETSTHYFFGYGFYHSMDDAVLEDDRHENDYEDVYICVYKDGSTYGEFQALVSNRHGDMLEYTSSDLSFTNDHAQIYISSNGDVTGSCGIYAHGHGIEAYASGTHCTGDDAIIYNVADQGETPSVCTGGAFTYSYNYSLIDIDELWNRRLNWDNYPFSTYTNFGGDDEEEYGGNPPWSKDFFKDPATKFLTQFDWLDDDISYSTDYLHNPYYGNASDGSGSPVTELGSDWSSTDIGSPDESGYSWIWKDTYTINGSGSDIWSTSDQFHFVYQSLSGNGTIIARLYSIQEDIHEWSKAGVMIRESLDADSKFSMLVGSSANGVSFQNRTSTGGSAASNTDSDLTAAPGWLKLTRSDDVFTSYYSEDGSTWTTINSKEISMSTSVYIGLAVSSHDTESLCSATFTDVSVDQSDLKSASHIGNTKLEEMNITAYGKEGNLVISSSSGSLENSRLTVYNLMGRIVLDTEVTSTYNEYPIASKGFYIIKIQNTLSLPYQTRVLIK